MSQQIAVLNGVGLGIGRPVATHDVAKVIDSQSRAFGCIGRVEVFESAFTESFEAVGYGAIHVYAIVAYTFTEYVHTAKGGAGSAGVVHRGVFAVLENEAVENEVSVIVCAGDIALKRDPGGVCADGSGRIEGDKLRLVCQKEAVSGSGRVLPAADAVAL